MKEIWSEIDGFPNYMVSNLGFVTNIKRRREITPRSNGQGYLKVLLHNEGYMEDLYLHRLVASCFLPGFRDGLQVTHHNGDKSNCRVDNLRIRGRQPAHPLSPEEIPFPGRGKVRIVETDQVFINVRALAQYIGGDYGSVYAVLRGERRTHHGYTFEYLEGHHRD